MPESIDVHIFALNGEDHAHGEENIYGYEVKYPADALPKAGMLTFRPDLATLADDLVYNAPIIHHDARTPNLRLEYAPCQGRQDARALDEQEIQKFKNAFTEASLKSEPEARDQLLPTDTKRKDVLQRYTNQGPLSITLG